MQIPTLILGSVALIVVASVVALMVFIILIMLSRLLGLWIQAFVSNAPVSMTSLVGMWLRKVNPRIIVLSRIQAMKAGLDFTPHQLELHYLARGNVPLVVNAMIYAHRYDIEMDWDTACKIDLAGRDPLAEVRAQIKPEA